MPEIKQTKKMKTFVDEKIRSGIDRELLGNCLPLEVSIEWGSPRVILAG